MKKILVISLCLFLAGNVYSDKSECGKKADETFTTERDACKEKTGEEKGKCIAEAKTKKKASMQECHKVVKECVEKARGEKKTAMEGCREKKAEEKKECKTATEKKFEESRDACKKS